jgi:hypothetical protein
MNTIILTQKGRTLKEYHPHRPGMVKPTIEKEFYQGKGMDRLRLYLTTDGRTFMADIFDRIFNVAVKVTIKSKYYKSKSLKTVVE